MLQRFHCEPLVGIYVGAWFLFSVTGLWMLFQYVSTPGGQPAAPQDWPSECSIERATDAQTLVMFVHPHCPCTRASLRELERVVAQSGGAVNPRIVISLPSEAPADWRSTELRNLAERIPGSIVIDDADGEEARRFGVGISGTTLLYDARGKLAFQGGITAGRGHQGDNAGESA
ncbi:MAG TPA: hypothetical protein VGJ26_18455, partial [Pirellulales bacterium]